MVRRVFFSFDYDRDVFRAEKVRNSWVTQDREAAGFWDAAEREKVKRGGGEAIKRFIDRNLQYTSVTAVLIGAETSTSRWVKYEITQSIAKGNGLLGVRIHHLKDNRGLTGSPGRNPLDDFIGYDTYDWIPDSSYRYFGDWVEKAARQAGR